MKVPSEEILRRLPLFAGLGDEALAAVARRTAVRKLAKDTTLFRAGEPSRGLYVVVEGSIRVYRGNRDGKEQVLHIQGPGQAVAEVPLFDGGPYPASARTLEDTVVLFLPHDDFAWLYSHNPEIADVVIRELGRRLRRMVGLVEKLSLKDVPARVASTLLEYAERASAAADGGEFELPRTQEQLAAELGTTRESVARALSRLHSEGIIERRGGRVRVVDLGSLETVAYSTSRSR